MMEKQWFGLIAFVVVVAVVAAIWLSFMSAPETDRVTGDAFTAKPVVRDGQQKLLLIYSGQLNAYDQVPHDGDLSNFKVLVTKADGSWEELPLEGETEPYDIISVNLPDDALTYSVWYDDGREEYRIIDPRQVPVEVE